MTPRVGVDVAAIPRIAEAHRRFGSRFLHKFLSDREIAYCGESPERWAGRWAAKEAIGKAMPSGIPRPRMRDVEILPSDDGRPQVRVAPATTLTGKTVDVSIAHDGHFAVAVAVIPDAMGLEVPPLLKRLDFPPPLAEEPLSSGSRDFPRGQGQDGGLPEGFRLPARPRDGHKGTFGTVVVLAGSQGFTGAAYLAAMGAARAGSGLVRLLVAQSIYPILAEKCTEVIVGPVPEISPGVVGHAALSGVMRGFAGADAGVIGPGIGRDASTRRLIEDLVPRVPAPLVIDADGLNLLSEHRAILPRLSPQIVLTPHPAELAAWLRKPVTPSRMSAARASRKIRSCSFVKARSRSAPAKCVQNPSRRRCGSAWTSVASSTASSGVAPNRCMPVSTLTWTGISVAAVFSNARLTRSYTLRASRAATAADSADGGV